MKKDDSIKQNKAKILPFRQDIDFFLKRGNIGLEENDPLKAVVRYRKAYEQDVTDLDSCLGLADTLGRMQRYEESNRLLMVDMSMNDPDPEHYFGMATNYYGLQEFGYAKEALETYLKMEPEGYYAADAMDFLDVLEDEEELAFQVGAAKDETTETLTICARARQAMCCGQPEMAEALLREHLKAVPGSLRVRNQLAAICFFLGNTKEANRLLDGILKEDPKDIHAKASRIAFLLSEKKQEEASRALEELSHAQLNEPDEISSVAFLQMEMELYDKALQNLESLAEFLPYDQQVLHQLAMARYHTGDVEGACTCYRNLLSIDPEDTVAAYYLKACKKAGQEGNKQFFMPNYEVPYQETLRRLEVIKAYYSYGPQAVRELLESDREARSLIRWALNSQEQRHKPAIMSMIAGAGGLQAEIMLRDFLLRTDQHDMLKHEALSCLKYMKARDPFMAFLNGQWIMGEISRILSPEDMPAAVTEVLDILSAHDVGNNSEACLGHLSRAVSAFMAIPDVAVLSKAQRQAMAAALECIAHLSAGEAEQDQQAMAVKYGVTVRRINNALDRLGPLPDNI